MCIRDRSKVQAQIREIYHKHNGVDGYRSMAVYLARKGVRYSPVTIHKYMNKEMGLYAIVRPKKPEYMHGKPHKMCIRDRGGRKKCNCRSGAYNSTSYGCF